MDPAATTEPLTAIWVNTWTSKPIGCRLYAGREVWSAASGQGTHHRKRGSYVVHRSTPKRVFAGRRSEATVQIDKLNVGSNLSNQ